MAVKPTEAELADTRRQIDLICTGITKRDLTSFCDLGIKDIVPDGNGKTVHLVMKTRREMGYES